MACMQVTQPFHVITFIICIRLQRIAGNIKWNNVHGDLTVLGLRSHGRKRWALNTTRSFQKVYLPQAHLSPPSLGEHLCT